MRNNAQPEGERSGYQDVGSADVRSAPTKSTGRRLLRQAAKAAAMCVLMLGAAEAAGVLFIRVVQGLDGDAVSREKAAIYERLPALQYVDDMPKLRGLATASRPP